MFSRICLSLAATAAVALIAAPAAPATLKPPAPRSPAPGAHVETVPAFTWGGVRRAAQYEFQVAADPGFGSIVNKGLSAPATPPHPAKLARRRNILLARARDRRDDAAGRWSRTRTFEKGWSTAPQLLEPVDAFPVSWPTFPLVLRWAVVPHATKYHVTIATDPSLANPVIGTATKPVETQGTVFALSGALAPGTYYWAVTPVDANNFKGRRSRVGSFSWGWPSLSTGRVLDLDPAPGVFDPLLQWDSVAGASKYEVEVNPTAEFTPGSQVFGGIANGTSIAPTVHLANNTYHWRVRAIDPDGNAGAWNVGPVFKKEFDDVTPTVSDIRMRHDTADLGLAPATSEPFFTWGAVPGATAYELKFAEYAGGGCEWGTPGHLGHGEPRVGGRRAATTSGEPGQASITWPHRSRTEPLYLWPAVLHGNPGARRRRRGESNASDWTHLEVNGEPTQDKRCQPSPMRCRRSRSMCSRGRTWGLLPTGSLHRGQSGKDAVLDVGPDPRRQAYFVVVARDVEFSEVIDYRFTGGRSTRRGTNTWTRRPRTTGPWSRRGPRTAVRCPDQGGRRFHKRSVPPALIGPVDGEDVPVQPLFLWGAVESAATYKLEVASDPGFGVLLDDVTTAATAYASTKAYPADTRLYWRVRANTRTVSLNWSETRSFRRPCRCPRSLETPSGGETIPVLAWHPVEGAVSYDMHVDQADGTQRDFNMRSTRFTPALFYGTGIWRWRVRANFPGNVHGGYSAAGVCAPHQRARGGKGRPGARPDAVHMEP